jgi:hypothetical protein
MAIERDDMISLPSPPPPRPAARRAAIETALRKFDGIEEPATGSPARQRARRIQWATLNRRPAGSLVAAAIIAVVCIPAIQIAMRDRPPEIATEAGVPSVQPARDGAAEVDSADAASPAQAEEAGAVLAEPSPTMPESPSATGAEVRAERSATESDRMVSSPPPTMATPAPSPFAAAPPPPPPSPAPPAAETEQKVSDAENIVVTGSRIPRPNLESASPVTVIGDSYGEFLSRLQMALRANDRRAIIRLVALPLRVRLDGEWRAYRSPREVERDFDRIFTADVRLVALNLRPGALISRDGGRLRGNDGLWFGCASKSCSSGNSIRIREVTP